MNYKVVKTDVIDPEINSEEWLNATVGFLNHNSWTEYCNAPKTSFKMLQGIEGISLFMESEETRLRTECSKENGDVYCDSCMEFFFKPDVHDTRYLNFEINPKGVLHLGLGDGRHNRVLLDTDRRIFNINTEVYEGGWRLKLYIPYDFLLSIFEKISNACKGNFYKCGDKTDHPHYGAWSKVLTASPDFHVPDFFGVIEFAKGIDKPVLK